MGHNKNRIRFIFILFFVFQSGINSFGQLIQLDYKSPPDIYPIPVASCGIPQHLISYGITLSSVNLTWDEVADAHYYHILYRIVGAQTWSSTTSLNDTFVLSGLAPLTYYEFQVQSICSAGPGNFSNLASFLTLGNCPTSANPFASAITDTTAVLNWSFYSGVSDYNYRYRLIGTMVWTTDSSLNNSVVLSGLTPSSSYEFEVQTVCSPGIQSPYSTPATPFSTLSSSTCPAPSGLFASSVSDSSAILNWSSVGGAVNYLVRCRLTGTVTWSNYTSVTNSLYITFPTSGSNYEFQVMVVCSSGSSNYSPSATFASSSPCDMTDINLFTSTNITFNSCTIGWGSVPGAQSYNTRYRAQGSPTWITAFSSTNSKSLTGLTAATQYEFQVQTSCGSSVSSYSSSGIFMTLPFSCGVPNVALFSVTNITPNSCTVVWASVPGAMQYNIRFRVNGSSVWNTGASAASSTNLSGLFGSTQYEYQLQTLCNGSISAFSASAYFATPGASCAAPNVAFFTSTNITSSSCTVGWNTVSGALSYKVQYRENGSAGSWFSVSTLSNSAILTGLVSSTQYEFQVQSLCNGSTSPFSVSGIFSTLNSGSCALPDTATVVFSSVTVNTCNVTWGPVSGASGYNIQYRAYGNGATWNTIYSSTNSIALSGLSSSTQFEFQVQTVCSGSTSLFTDSRFFTTLASPCSVPNVLLFTSTNITSSSCTVGWATIPGAVQYNVNYRINGSTGSWNLVTSVTNSANLSGLQLSTWYEFQVQTVCSGSSSAFSASGIFLTTANPCGVPNAALFTSTNITSSSCTLGWGTVSGAVTYNVEYRVKNSGSAWSMVTSNTNSAYVSGLSASTIYEFRVQTLCSGGATSAYSSTGIFTTLSGGGSCGTPSGLGAGSITSISATLSWTAVSGAVSYTIQYRLVGTSTWNTTSSTTSWKAVSGLAANSNYEFQVQCNCSSSSGLYSSVFAFMTSSGTSVGLPVPDHIVICIFENHAFQNIIGNSAAPYMNALVSDPMATLFTQSYGNEHPSQPNYLDLFSGSNQGITNNNLPPSHFTTPNLARQLLDAGRTFITYSEDLPSVGWDGVASAGYVRKHNPVANWMGSGPNQVPASLNLAYTAFPSNYATLPTVSYVVPNLVNGMHDGTGNTAIAAGDNWFHANMEAYIQWAKVNNSLFILTFDEDDNVHSNLIPTIFVGAMVAHTTISTPMTHYNILRTIEDMYGLPYIGNAATVNPIHGCWTNGFRTRPEAGQNLSAFEFELFPNPVRDLAMVRFSLEENANVRLRLYTMMGEIREEKSLGNLEPSNYEMDFPMGAEQKGIYYFEMTINDRRFLKRLVKID